jgi:membrane-bound ClpP family serine protease
MSYVPHWVGVVGLVLALLVCGTALAGLLWLTVLLMIPAFALVIVESRYERGLIGTRRG